MILGLSVSWLGGGGYVGYWVYVIVSPDESRGYLGIQYGHAAAAAEISFGRDNLKNILVSTFKFGMWVYMGNATNAIVW